MYLLTVTLYEFGQFLRILLWIFIPMVIIASLITTYMHYNRSKIHQEEKDGQDAFSDLYGPGSTPAERGEASMVLALNGQVSDAGSNGTYKGMLWIKEKYEQYREIADNKYERLKEELSENHRLLSESLQLLSESRQLLSECQATIERLTCQLQQEACQEMELSEKLVNEAAIM